MKILYKIVTTSISLLILVACGTVGTPSDNINNESTAQEVTEALANGEVVFLLPSDPVSLDPHLTMDIISLELERNMYSRLLMFYENNENYIELAPYLAESFEQVDPLTWVFNLRQDVLFHDGTPFDAYAAYINFVRVLNPDFASPRLFILDIIDRVEIIDEFSIRIITHFPFSPLPNNLAHSPHFVSPAAIAEEESGGRLVWENAVGTGPFKFVSQSFGDEIRLKRFYDFFRGPAQIAYLTYRIIPEPATRLLLIEAGEAHATQITPTDAQLIENNQNINLHLIESTRSIFLGFNNSRPPFNNQLLRQAVYYAINKEEILQGIVEGFGTMAYGPVSPVIQGAAQGLNLRPYNIELARELVIEAGFENGLDITLYTNEGNSIQAMIMEYVQASLSRIGINASLNIVEWGTFLEITANGIPDMFVHGWSTTTGDADYGIFMLFHSSVPGGSGNRAHYSSPQVDDLLYKARSITDLTERTELYTQISQILIDDAATIFLYYPFIPVATTGIDNIVIDFNGTSSFHNVVLQ